jgi:hypothetical protein
VWLEETRQVSLFFCKLWLMGAGDLTRRTPVAGRSCEYPAGTPVAYVS